MHKPQNVRLLHNLLKFGIFFASDKLLQIGKFRARHFLSIQAFFELLSVKISQSFTDFSLRYNTCSYTMPDLGVLLTNILIVNGYLPLHVTQTRLYNEEGRITALIQFCACLHLKLEPQSQRFSYPHLQAVKCRYTHLQGVTSQYTQLQGMTSRYTHLQGVTSRYTQLQRVTSRYTKLQGVTSCYTQLQGVTSRYTQLHTVTHSYKGLQAVTHSYKGLHAVTKG